MLHFFDCSFKHIKIEFVNEFFFFEDGDKIGWRQKAFNRINPAGKGFLIADFAVYSTDNRLVVDCYPSFGNCFVEIFDDVAVIFFGVADCLIVIADSEIVAAFECVTGKLCAVTGNIYADIFILELIDTNMRIDIIIGENIVEFFGKSIESVFEIVVIGDGCKMNTTQSATVIVAKIAGKKGCKRF